MTHKAAIRHILEQFDSYKTNCAGCTKQHEIDAEDLTFVNLLQDCVCGSCELFCRDKLLEAAEELDADKSQKEE